MLSTAMAGSPRITPFNSTAGNGGSATGTGTGLVPPAGTVVPLGGAMGGVGTFGPGPTAWVTGIPSALAGTTAATGGLNESRFGTGISPLSRSASLFSGEALLPGAAPGGFAAAGCVLSACAAGCAGGGDVVTC